MAAIKLLTTAVIFYILNASRDYWYPLIQWAVNLTVIASISWFIARRVTRYVICRKLLPTVDPSDKAILITGEWQSIFFLFPLSLSLPLPPPLTDPARRAVEINFYQIQNVTLTLASSFVSH